MVMFLVTVEYLSSTYLVFEGMKKAMESVFYAVSFFLLQIIHSFGEHTCVCVRAHAWVCVSPIDKWNID